MWPLEQSVRLHICHLNLFGSLSTSFNCYRDILWKNGDCSESKNGLILEEFLQCSVLEQKHLMGFDKSFVEMKVSLFYTYSQTFKVI